MFSISKFRSLLEDVASNLVTLSNVEVVRDIHEQIALYQSKSYIEAQIYWRGELYALALPLDPSALAKSERLGVKFRALESDLLLEQQVMRNELIYYDSRGELLFVDLLLSRMPKGVPLEDFVERKDLDYTRLCGSLYAMESELKALGIVHNNLKSYNIVVDPATYRLYPIRHYYAEFTSESDDQKGIDYLAYWLAERCGCPIIERGASLNLTTQRTKTIDDPRFEWTGNLFEGLRCVSNRRGYGFIDHLGEVVIAPIFEWANDFHEDRAEVRTPTGMGVIDRHGQYVIEPIYEVAEFDSRSTLIHVRRNGEWIDFNYNGKQIIKV